MKSQINTDKKSQEKKNINVQPVKPEINKDVMQLPIPAVPYGYRRLCKDQTCQSTRCYKKCSDPKKRQKMQYKVKSNLSMNQEDKTLDVTSEKLSPRSHKSQVTTQHKSTSTEKKKKYKMCVKRDIKAQA